MSSINGRGYDVVDIANWFHNLPHLGKDLKQISNTTFDPMNQQYVTSLAVYLALPIAIMVIILVLYLLVTIILCCCCTDGQKRKSIRVECKVFIFLFGLVCGLSFISGLYGDWQIYQGVKSVHNSSQDGVNWLNQIKTNSRNLFDITFNVDNTIRTLKSNIEELESRAGGALPSDELAKYKENCANIIDYLGNTKIQVNDANKTLNDAKYEEVPQYVDKYGTLFCIIAVCVLSSIAIIGLVFTFAICSRCILGCFTVLAVFAFILSSLLVGTTLFASVGTSDFCVDDKRWMKTLVNKDIGDYLIECTSDNVVAKTMTRAQDYIKKATETNQQLASLKTLLNEKCVSEPCPQDIKNKIITQIDGLKAKIPEISQLVNDFTDLAQCRRINTDLNHTLNSICTDIIKGVVMIFFNTIVAALCFGIIVFSATIALR